MTYFYTNIKDKTKEEIYLAVNALVAKYPQYVNFDSLVKECSLYPEHSILVAEQSALWLIPADRLSTFDDAISVD